MSTKHRKLMALLVVLLCLPTISFGFLGESQTQNQVPYSPNRIIVKFKPAAKVNFSPAKSGAPETGIKAVDDVSRRFGVTGAKGLLPESIRSRHKEFSDVHILTVPDKSNIEEIVRAYRALPQVEYAEPDARIELFSSPNDTYYTDQWYLNNTGQQHYIIDEHQPCNNDDEQVLSTGTVDADIDADEVFNNPPTNTTTSIVAILDTGVDTDHPDLADKIWVNVDEIPDNGLDDDNNGYIDDVKGWDFEGEYGYTPNNDPTDEFGHGTHCAGIVGAVANNNTGIAGVAPDVQIMALRALAPLGLASFISEGLIYAVDNGADVVSMSFGLLEPSQFFEDVCQFANDRGVTLVAAMGNSGSETFSEPAIYPTTIAVGATDQFDHVTYYSTYGDHISVVAPGEDILSLRADQTDMYDNPFCPEPNSHIFDEIYYFASGTSMATPMTAAVASYLHAVSPGLSPEMTRQIIEQSADDFTEPYGPSGPTGLTGWDVYSGYGRINLYQTLQNAPATRARIMSPLNGGYLSGDIDISGIADWTGTNSYTLEYGEGELPDSWTTIVNSSSPVASGILGTWHTAGLSGVYTLRLRVGDDNISTVAVNVVNGDNVSITSPQAGDTVKSLTDIFGSGYAYSGLDSLVLEYGSGDPLTFGPGYGEVINVLTTPVFDGLLGTWYSHKLIPGDYGLRLGLYFGDALIVADTVQVYVQPEFTGPNSVRVNTGAFNSPVANFGDFDFDGENEIVVGTENGLEFFQPNGEPKTGGVPVLQGGNFFAPSAVGDLNGDGFDDLVALGGYPVKLYAFPSHDDSFEINLGTAAGASTSYNDEFKFCKIMLEDIDADGKDEIIINVVFYDNSTQVIGVFDDNGEALWGPLTYNNDMQGIFPADLDNDGVFEIYTFNFGGNILTQRNLDGSVLNSTLVFFNGSAVWLQCPTAFDVDYDGFPELIISGGSSNSDYIQYHAFNYDLTTVTGWPQETAIDKKYGATVPIFTDLNDDGEIEYYIAVQSFTASYIYAYKVDGSPALAGSNGVFYATTEPGIVNMLCVADIDGDQNFEMVGLINADLFRTNRIQRLMAWDAQGNVLPGYPKITGMVNVFGPELRMEESYRFTPTIGDLDKDGILDLFIPVTDSELIITQFPGVSYDPAKVLIPSWRYDRGHTANGPLIDGEITAPADKEVIAGEPDVVGSATGLYLQQYDLEYGAGPSPAEWYPIGSSNEPVIDGILGKWNVSGLEGQYTLRLRLQENQSVTRNVFVANTPVASITSPMDKDTIWGIQETTLSVEGSAMCLNFDHAVLEYGAGENPSEWETIATIFTPVYNSNIAQWTASDLSTGDYTLRLAVYSTSGLESTAEIAIVRQFYFADDNGWTTPLNGDGGATANYGDFDGDGTDEIVVGTSEGVYFFNLDGTPKTDGMPFFPRADYRIPVAVGSLDDDSLDDFVIIGVGATQATLYGFLSHNSNFAIALPTVPEMGRFVPEDQNFPFMPQLYLRDIDGDGLDEIHYFTGGTLSAKYYIFNHDGTQDMEFFPLEAPYLQAFPADLNSDGVCEIYASGLSAGDYSLKQYDLSGNVTNQFNLDPGGAIIVPMSFSAADVDSDGKPELLTLAYFAGGGRLYAFDDTLGYSPEWPITVTSAYMQHPVLADLDGDDVPEILTVYNSLNKVLAWNLDGTSYIPGANGLFAITENPGTLYAPVISDADGDGFSDLLFSANRTYPNSYYSERLIAYDHESDLVSPYPIVTSTDTRSFDRNLHVPIVGDLNKDGKLDVLVVSAEQKLMFSNFSNVAYDAALNQVPMWRYNRRLNNTKRMGHSILRVPDGFATIQAAIDAAIDGDTVLVAPGTYSCAPMSFHGKAITVKSENGPQSTTISGWPNCTIFSFADGETESSVLEGFKLSGGSMAVRCANSAPTIRRNIMANQISTLTGVGAICLWGDAFDSDGDSPAKIINNTIVGGNHSGIADRSSTPPDIRNNIIYDNDIYGIDFCTNLHKPWEHPVLDYNDVYGNGTNYHNVTNPGDGSISADPMFLLNYLISPLSPCYNAGDPDPQYNDPDGSRNDMGAIPYQELTLPPGPGHLKNSQIPDEFAISQNYPNPFNPTTTIRLSIPEASHVTVMIYNILGQRVATLVDGNMEPGYHDVVWSGKDDRGSAVASGIYLYRIVSNKFVATKKMVLLK